MAKKHLLGAVSTIVGYTIGAGILGIPFVFAKAGFLTGFIALVILGIIAMLINLYTGEISLRTKGPHQLTGYAKIYLGKWAKYIMLIAMMVGLYGALTAYILKGGEFLSALISPVAMLSPTVCSILFFTVGTILVFIGIKAIEKSEMVFFVFFILAVLAIFFISYPFIKISNISSFSLTSIFVPYGVILFAYSGIAAIPEMREELKKNTKVMKKAIFLGSLIPFIIYSIFAFAVVGVTGIDTTDGAILGLANAVGNQILLIGASFGIIAVFTSFLAVALSLKETYCFDLKISRNLSAALTGIIPLFITMAILYAKIDHAFFKILDITGAFTFSAIGILITLIINKAKKAGKRKPEYSIKINKPISFMLIALFLSGLVYEILRLLNII